MKLNFQGRISNVTLAYHRALLPLFEAVINSIHAIEDIRTSSGEIRIRIRRNKAEARQQHLTENRLTSRSIIGFAIEDNGCGFTTANYEAFETSDTDFKKSRGAKGIGRFLWLKAFEIVRVTSVYEENGKFWERKFDFTLTANGTSNHTLRETDARQNRTTVELVDFEARYEQECPRLSHTIAERTIEHCLSYLLRPNSPAMWLEDDDEEQPVDLVDLYRREIEAKAKRSEVKCRNIKLAVQHVRVFAGELSQHTIHLCAHDRDVQHLPLANYIPYIPQRFVTYRKTCSIGQIRLEKPNLRQPRVPLRWQHCELRICSQLADDFIGRSANKLADRRAIPIPKRSSGSVGMFG
jgi:hypothetical protein